MGRFGNVMLINGETTFSGEAVVGEVVRLYLVNTANTRIFNFAVSGARTKLVGGDSGRYEHETFVDEILLAPSERAVVDVLFETPGSVRLEHRTPDRTYDLGRFSVSTKHTARASQSFHKLRSDSALAAERRSLEHDMLRAPDKVLAFVSLMPLLYGQDAPPAELYACPMHPEVTATQPGKCPKCGMKRVPSQFFTSPAKRTRKAVGSNKVILSMPLSPASNARQDSCVPMPREVMRPIPVMTTPVTTASSLQLRMLLHLEDRRRQRKSNQPNRKLPGQRKSPTI